MSKSIPPCVYMCICLSLSLSLSKRVSICLSVSVFVYLPLSLPPSFSLPPSLSIVCSWSVISISFDFFPLPVFTSLPTVQLNCIPESQIKTHKEFIESPKSLLYLPFFLCLSLFLFIPPSPKCPIQFLLVNCKYSQGIHKVVLIHLPISFFLSLSLYLLLALSLFMSVFPSYSAFLFHYVYILVCLFVVSLTVDQHLWDSLSLPCPNSQPHPSHSHPHPHSHLDIFVSLFDKLRQGETLLYIHMTLSTNIRL